MMTRAQRSAQKNVRWILTLFVFVVGLSVVTGCLDEEPREHTSGTQNATDTSPGSTPTAAFRTPNSEGHIEAHFDTGSTSTTLSMEISSIVDDGDFIDHGFCWGTEQNPSHARASESNHVSCESLGTQPQVGTFEYHLTDLSPGRTYFVRGYVRTSEQTYYSEELSFSTSPAPIAQACDGHVVTIADANLDAVVRETLGIENGDIYCEDMLELDSLWAVQRDIETLDGLEWATNLEHLYLGRNSIRTLSPLSTLKKLEGLDASINPFEDINALSHLTNLTRLVMQEGSISDISALANLTNLEYVDLSRNDEIADVTPLASLSKLTVLALWRNEISDISSLSGLTALVSLKLGRNAITDVSSLSGLTNLEELDLGENAISGISALSGLTNLEWLSLSHNDLSDITALSSLVNLKTLPLSSNNIEDVSPLSSLTQLNLLSLDQNEIHDISALVGLTSLTSVNLDFNCLDLSDSRTHEHLESLRTHATVNADYQYSCD